MRTLGESVPGLGVESVEEHERLMREIKDRAKQEAFFAGYYGRFMPRYNDLTRNTTIHWFFVGERWWQREAARRYA